VQNVSSDAWWNDESRNTDDRRRSTQSGVARDLYKGGGCYAFVDGHVKFLRVEMTVGASRAAPTADVWAAGNHLNMWNPDR
jgi:prepilin-type processing-associated H-X9-DG protein